MTRKENNLLKYTVVALIVVNLISLGAHWFTRPGQGPGLQERPPGPGGFLDDQLNFDHQQREQHAALRQEHFHESRKILREIEDEKEQMMDLFSQENALQSASMHAEHIGQLQTQLEILTFNHFMKIRNICNEEQKPTFDLVIRDAIRRGPPPGGPGHGPHGPGRPHP
ncbi:MAG: periplasmic heavy metal sensor [Bacteroidia bacterium]|nr:periplasmic heavy metal sensor [Bacteroidia bacterium]